MKSVIKPFFFFFLAATVFSGCAMLAKKETTAVNDSGLVNSLTQKLGVSKEQATGGAGAILGYAKAKLSPDEFSTVNKSLPEADSLIKAAPKDDGMSTKLGSMASNLGGESSSAGGLGSLASSFGKLGLSPDMIGKFLPVILDYAKSAGGSNVSGLLQGVLK